MKCLLMIRKNVLVLKRELPTGCPTIAPKRVIYAIYKMMGTGTKMQKVNGNTTGMELEPKLK